MYNNYLELQYNISGNQAGVSTSSVMKLYESNSLSRLYEGLKKRKEIYIFVLVLPNCHVGIVTLTNGANSRAVSSPLVWPSCAQRDRCIHVCLQQFPSLAFQKRRPNRHWYG